MRRKRSRKKRRRGREGHTVLILMLELCLGYTKETEVAGNRRRSEIWTLELLRTMVLAV